jgi:hypothetical protein
MRANSFTSEMHNFYSVNASPYPGFNSSRGLAGYLEIFIEADQGEKRLFFSDTFYFIII